MVSYDEIDFFQFAVGTAQVALEQHVSDQLATHSVNIALCVQSLMTSKDHTEVDKLASKNIKGLLTCYPKAVENIQNFQKNPTEPSQLPEKLQYNLPQVWTPEQMEQEIDSFCNQLKAAYLLLHYKILESIHGKEKIHGIKHLFRVDSAVAHAVEIAKSEQKRKEAIDAFENSITDFKDDVAAFDDTYVDPETSAPDQEENSEKPNIPDAPTYSREELWQDELPQQKVDLYNVFERILKPKKRHKIRLMFGGFPFNDKHFNIVEDVLQDTPSAPACILVFELTKMLLKNKIGEAQGDMQATVEGIENVFNDGSHMINIQEMLYVHILVKENLERRQRDKLFQLLQMEYDRHSRIAKMSLRAYRLILNQYKTPIRHSMRETANLEELLHFMFQVSHNDGTAIVELPPSLIRLPIYRL